MIRVFVILPCGREISLSVSPRTTSSVHRSAGSDRETPRANNNNNSSTANFLTNSGGSTTPPRAVQCRDVLDELINLLKLQTTSTSTDAIDADTFVALDPFRSVSEGQRLCVFFAGDVSTVTLLESDLTAKGFSQVKAQNLALSAKCLWKLQAVHHDLLHKELSETKELFTAVQRRLQDVLATKATLLEELGKTKLPFKDASVRDELNSERLDDDMKSSEKKLQMISAEIDSASAAFERQSMPFGASNSWESVTLPSSVVELQKHCETKLVEVRQLIKSYTMPRQKFAKAKSLLRAIEQRVLGPFERLSGVPEALRVAEDLIVRRVLLRRAVRRLLAPLEEDHRQVDRDTREFLENSGRRMPSGLIQGLLTEPPPLYPRDDDVAVRYDGQYIDREDDGAQVYVEKVCRFYLPQFERRQAPCSGASDSAEGMTRENTEAPLAADVVAKEPPAPVAPAPPGNRQQSTSSEDSDKSDTAEILNKVLLQNTELQKQLEDYKKQKAETSKILEVLRESVLGGRTLQQEIRAALVNSTFHFYRKQREQSVSFETEWKFEKYGLPCKLLLADATLDALNQRIKTAASVMMTVIEVDSIVDGTIWVNGSV